MNNKREIAEVSFTINGDFITNAIESFSKMNGDVEENHTLKFESMVDTGDGTYEIKCSLFEEVLH